MALNPTNPYWLDLQARAEREGRKITQQEFLDPKVGGSMAEYRKLYDPTWAAQVAQTGQGQLGQQVIPGTGVIMNNGIPVAPGTDLSTPQGMASTQEQYNRYNAQLQQLYNRVNETNPYGQATYVQNPDGTVTRQINLSASQQTLLDQQQQRDIELGNQGGQKFVEAAKTWGTAPDYSKVQKLSSPTYTGLDKLPDKLDYSNIDKLPDNPNYSKAQKLATTGYEGIQGINTQANYNKAPRILGGQDLLSERQRVEDTLYNAQMKRLDPVFAKQKEDLAQKLANQGIPTTSERYKRELANLDQNQSDARIQAQAQASQQGLGEQQGLYGMSLSSRQQGVGESNSLWGQALQARQQRTGEADTTFGKTLSARQQGVGEQNNLLDYALQKRQQGVGEQNNITNYALQRRQQGVGEVNTGFQNTLQARQQGMGEVQNAYNLPFQQMQAYYGLQSGVQNPTFSGIQDISVPQMDLLGTGANLANIGSQAQIAQMDDATKRYLGELNAQTALETAGMAASGEDDWQAKLDAQTQANINQWKQTVGTSSQYNQQQTPWWQTLIGNAAGGFAQGYGYSLFGGK